MRTRRRTFHTRRRVRKWEWIYKYYTTGTAGTEDRFDLLADWRAKMGITANLPDMTISRVRANVTVSMGAAQAPTFANSCVQVGLIVLPSTIASTSIPNPVTDPWNDWLYWNSHAINFDSAVNFGTLTQPLVETTVMDTKAMRRMKNIDDTLWLSWGAVDGTTSYELAIQFAIGVKLP